MGGLTYLDKIRKTRVIEEYNFIKRSVPVLHIDADEGHINLQNGCNTIAPIISVYEGFGSHGKRRYCKNIFHNTFYEEKSDDIWETVISRIERRYDLTNTKIYLHGDGASWIKKGLEWLPNAVYVLDKYHFNKYVKSALAGLSDKIRGN